MLTQDDLAQIAALMKAQDDQQVHCERKARARRRIIVVGLAIGSSWFIAKLLHFEQAHEAIIVGIDGFVAANLDKLIYGIG